MRFSEGIDADYRKAAVPLQAPFAPPIPAKGRPSPFRLREYDRTFIFPAIVAGLVHIRSQWLYSLRLIHNR